jgi:hypothetical protein
METFKVLQQVASGGSKPTVWDGDLVFQTFQMFSKLVLSPPCGMETFKRNSLKQIFSEVIVLSPPCGMETWFFKLFKCFQNLF